MATIAQGIEAGNLANGLNLLTAFVQALNAAILAGAQVNQLTLGTVGLPSTIQFTPPAPLTVADSAALMHDLVTLSAGLQAEWTAALNAL